MMKRKKLTQAYAWLVTGNSIGPKTAKGLAALILAMLLAALPVAAATPGESAETEHFFPLIADGDGFRSRLFVTNVSDEANHCTLSLRGPGLDVGVFQPNNAVTPVGDGASIYIRESGASLTLASVGGIGLTFGYMKLDCAGPAAARMLLSLENGGTLLSLATLESASPGRSFQFPVLPRLGRLAMVFSNEAGLDARDAGIESLEGLQHAAGLTRLDLGPAPWHPENGYVNSNRVTDLSPIVGLSNLEVLDLRDNELSGSIPPELGQLGNLRYLNLEGNELSGPIPSDLGQLTNLRYLHLGDNRLAGDIPEALGRLSNLENLDLWGNELSGPIPPELGQLTNLRYLNLGRNLGMKGSLPWTFGNKIAQGELIVYTGKTSITGVESPLWNRPDPNYSLDPARNGNAAFNSISLFQGPLVLRIEQNGERIEYQTPIVNRRAAVAVSIDHRVTVPPVVAGRVSDGADAAGRELRAPGVVTTEKAGETGWCSEYVFSLPGNMFNSGNRIVFTIDPDNELPETDEADNESEPLVLEGEVAPDLRITFIPFHLPGEDPPQLDTDVLMKGIEAYFPISDKYEAKIGPAIQWNSLHDGEMIDKLAELWNLEAKRNEFYHGIHMALNVGQAAMGGRIAISAYNIFGTIPHEFGHNLNLRHPPGCDARGPDEDYPYPGGKLGPARGWDHNWHRFVPGKIEGVGDVMSYCTRVDFISDYHYAKAWNYWREHGTYSNTSSVSTTASASESTVDDSGATPLVSTQSVLSEETRSLALSGRLDADGVWRLGQAQISRRGPRPSAETGEFTLILFDGAGVQVYAEPLAVMRLSDSDESFWAARVPLPVRTAREILILDAEGNEVLRQPLPEPQ